MTNIIETFDLTKYYKNNVIGIENLSLSVQEGEIYGFLGRNGAGKTTTIRMLVNLLFPTAGSAKILGKDIHTHHLEICRETGYIPSSVTPHRHMTGQDFLDYMGRLSAHSPTSHHDTRNDRASLLKKFDLSPKDIQRKIKEYSTGMARKIAIIQAFQHKPRLIIMDEPTEGLDPMMQHTFYQLLKEYQHGGGTVFISSHRLLEVEQVCDRAAIIRDGRLVTVENIPDLIKHPGRIIRVTFKHPVNPSQLDSPAWQITQLDNTTLEATITGDINDIIKLISRFDIQDISLPNRTLQDVFLGYYQSASKEEDQ